MPYMVVREYGRKKQVEVSLYAIPYLLLDTRKVIVSNDPHSKLRRICDQITEITGIPYSDISNNNRKFEIRVARQVFCYIACNTTPYTYSCIGKFINKHHTTIIHSKQEVAEKIKINDSAVMNIISQYKSK